MLSGLIILTGLVLVFLVPEGIMLILTKVVIGSTSKVLIFFYGLLSGLIMISGVALLLFTIPFYRGDYWARALVLGMLAIPAVGGAFILETVSSVSRDLVGYGIILFLIGFIPYSIILLWDGFSLKDKLVRFSVFSLAIIAIAVNLFAAYEALLYNSIALTTSPVMVEYAYVLGITSVLIGIVLALLGIPLLALGTKIGFWSICLGMSAMIAGTGRFVAIEHPHMALYFPAVVVAGIVLILLVVFRGRLEFVL